MGQQENLEPIYSINHSKLVSETIDGEAIIVHLETGAYYSLRGSAALIWDQLLEGDTLSHLTSYLEEQVEAVSEPLEADLAAFLSDLQAEGLVILVEGQQKSGQNSVKIGQKSAYVKPMVDKFTDMSDLLLLDPIHQVEDEEGWPFKKKTF